MNFCGKVPVNKEDENNKQKMEILISERTDITPLLGMGWKKRFTLAIERIQMMAETIQSEKKEYSTNFPICLKTTEQ